MRCILPAYTENKTHPLILFRGEGDNESEEGKGLNDFGKLLSRIQYFYLTAPSQPSLAFFKAASLAGK